MDKSKLVRIEIAGSGGTHPELINPVQVNRKCHLEYFGAIDMADGTGLGSVYILQWGSGSTWEDLRVISLVGDTAEIKIDRTFLGNGVNRFRVIMRNDGNIKDLVFWIKAKLLG